MKLEGQGIKLRWLIFETSQKLSGEKLRKTWLHHAKLTTGLGETRMRDMDDNQYVQSGIADLYVGATGQNSMTIIVRGLPQAISFK
jgi:hypothetical protein